MTLAEVPWDPAGDRVRLSQYKGEKYENKLKPSPYEVVNAAWEEKVHSKKLS